MNKITEGIISRGLLEIGIDTSKLSDDEYIKKLVLNEYELNITDQYDSNCDFFMYEEETSDGYQVYIATPKQNSIIINEDVYYSENSLIDAFFNAVVYGHHGMNIYVSEQHEEVVSEAMFMIFDSILKSKKDLVISNLKQKGYED